MYIHIYKVMGQQCIGQGGPTYFQRAPPIHQISCVGPHMPEVLLKSATYGSYTFGVHRSQ